MITVALVGILVGGALGLCFRVWILVPASLVAIAVISLSGIAAHSSLMPLAGRVALVILTLQAGYCIGLATRHLAIVARAPALRKAVASARRTRLSRV